MHKARIFLQDFFFSSLAPFMGSAVGGENVNVFYSWQKCDPYRVFRSLLLLVLFEGTGQLIEKTNLLAVLQKTGGSGCLVWQNQTNRFRWCFRIKQSMAFACLQNMQHFLSVCRKKRAKPAIMTESVLAGPNFSVISCLCLCTARWSSLVNLCSKVLRKEKES